MPGTMRRRGCLPGGTREHKDTIPRCAFACGRRPQGDPKGEWGDTVVEQRLETAPEPFGVLRRSVLDTG